MVCCAFVDRPSHLYCGPNRIFGTREILSVPRQRPPFATLTMKWWISLTTAVFVVLVAVALEADWFPKK